MGWLIDGTKLPLNKVRWVALVGGDKESFVQMGWEKNISDYLKNMCSYLGIEDADVTFLCNTVVFDGEELHASYYQSLLSRQGYGRCTIRCVKNAVAE